MIKQYTDPEFGTINISLRAGLNSIRISMGTDGRLKASAPHLTPVFAIKAMVNASRPKIRQIFQPQLTPPLYRGGQLVGKSHHIVLVPVSDQKNPQVRISGQNIIVRLAASRDIASTGVQRQLRDSVISALRTEAKAYLPRRLKELASRGGYHYSRVRFSHAGTRWGSCSSTGTISLNIALMKLPDNLIDYVLCHELAHTRHMNHSAAFWAEVAQLDPLYRGHRKLIQQEHPII